MLAVRKVSDTGNWDLAVHRAYRACTAHVAPDRRLQYWVEGHLNLSRGSGFNLRAGESSLPAFSESSSVHG